MAGVGLPTKEEEVLVIACAGVLGWLLMLGITLCLGAAAKRGDELELDAQRYLPELVCGSPSSVRVSPGSRATGPPNPRRARASLRRHRRRRRREWP